MVFQGEHCEGGFDSCLLRVQCAVGNLVTNNVKYGIVLASLAGRMGGQQDIEKVQMVAAGHYFACEVYFPCNVLILCYYGSNIGSQRSCTWKSIQHLLTVDIVMLMVNSLSC